VRNAAIYIKEYQRIAKIPIENAIGLICRGNVCQISKKNEKLINC